MAEKELLKVRPNKKIYREDDKLIKLFDHNIVKKSEVLKEAYSHALVEETGLSVPKLLYVNNEGEDWAIATEYINGNTIETLMKNDPDNKKKYIDKLVELQMAISKISCSDLKKLRDKMNDRISHSGLEATVRYELHVRLDSLPRHNKLCHGDFNPSNVLVDENGKYYILDWAHATQGNASADAATTYIQFLLTGDKASAEYYLKAFCKKTDTALQYVQKWMPIVAAALSVKASPEDRAALLKMVNVVEYE